MQVKLCQ